MSTLSKPIKKKAAKQTPSVPVNTGPARIEIFHQQLDGDNNSDSDEFLSVGERMDKSYLSAEDCAKELRVLQKKNGG